MHTFEEEPIEPQQLSPPVLEPVASSSVAAVLVCLVAAWIGAGSTGLLAHPLRRVLTLLALGVALLAVGFDDSRRSLRILLTPLVACAAAYMVYLASPTANIMAAAVVLAFLAMTSTGRGRDALQAGAVAVAVFGLYHFVRTSIPWVWLGADHAGQGLANLVGMATQRQVHVGATFAGLDCLVVMGVLWALYVRSTQPPRTARAIYGFAAIAGGHLLYLIALSYVPTLAVSLAQFQSQEPSSLTGLLRQAIPWNIPVMACAIQLVIAAAMLRWSAQIGPQNPQQANRSVPSLAARLALVTAALAMTILLPVTTMFRTSPLTATGKKIVFYEKGFLNWLKPTHDSYGRLSSGMYGMLPAFVESLGAECVISSELSETDLKDTDALVLIFPDEPWSDGQRDRIESFVRQGGSLLVMGEHTTADPNGGNRFNEVLAPTAIDVRFDSATFAVGGWLHSYQAINHPTTAGIADDRNLFGVVIGASVETRWPARPLLVGRWGWTDDGDEASDRAMMGNGRYDAGEKLGDIVLVAEQPLGKGKVIVFGDTSNLSNGINVSSHVFNSRLFAYLAGRQDAHPAWRQLVGLLVAAFLVVLLCKSAGPWRVVLVAVGLSVSSLLCLAANPAGADILPDGRIESPNNLAYIDSSGLPTHSGESWRPDGIGGLALTLMRNGYMPLALDELTPRRLERAGLLVCGARSRAFSKAEVQAVHQFVDAGGILVMTAGQDRIDASLPLLRQFGFRIGPNDVSEPAPLGHFKSPYLESASRRVYVRFHAAWPIQCTDPNAQVIAGGRNNQPVILLRRVGAGKVVFVGDTFFATNQNLEHEDGTPFEGLRENADFWRWLITLLRNEQVWVPRALQDAAASNTPQEVTP